MSETREGSVRPTRAYVLWATCERFPDPQFVGAWPSGLVEAWSEWYYELRADAVERFEGFDDERHDWTYFGQWVDMALAPESAEQVEREELEVAR